MASRLAALSCGAKPNRPVASTPVGTVTMTALAINWPLVVTISTCGPVESTRTTRVPSFTGTLAPQRATSAPRPSATEYCGSVSGWRMKSRADSSPSSTPDSSGPTMA